MRYRAPLIAVIVMVVSAAIIFTFFQRQLGSSSVAFGSHPEVLQALETSLEDLKLMARLDPGNEAIYRQRFDSLATTTNRLQILEHTHDDLVERYETVLLILFALSVVVVTGIYAARQSRHEPRLDRLQRALTGLAQGQTDIDIGDRGRDTIGRISSMVERTSKVMARDQRRLAALRNLSAWQEAARRHAHEIRTPLTGAKLELTRVCDLLKARHLDNSDEIVRAATGAQLEIDRLNQFTKQFHSFARLPEPDLKPRDLGALLEEMVATYDSAWANLALEVEAPEGIASLVDRDLMRQVLVNLCDNSSQALNGANGVVRIRLQASSSEAQIDVTDNGQGVAEEIASRIFEPYSTTKQVGEGVGLGLPISKKILLDHNGDLELSRSDSNGTTFRLTLPREQTTETEL